MLNRSNHRLSMLSGHVRLHPVIPSYKQYTIRMRAFTLAAICLLSAVVATLFVLIGIQRMMPILDSRSERMMIH